MRKYYKWEIQQALKKTKGTQKEGLVQFKNIWLTPSKALTMLEEWQMWERYYLPPFSLTGKTVLDVGAGSGESAFFYNIHGASKIVCIESGDESPDDLKCLELNKAFLPITIIPHRFNLTDLQIPHDFMKMDIEGSESLLVDYHGTLKPSFVESHSDSITKSLLKNHGFKFIGWCNKEEGFSFVTNY